MRRKLEEGNKANKSVRAMRISNISGVKLLGMVLAALFFSMIIIPTGFAAIAVKEGDWAKYKVEAELPSEGVGVALPLDEVEWMKIEVKSVSGTNVTVEATLRFKNGTELADTVDGIASSFIIDTAIANSDEGTVAFPSLGLFGAFLPGESVCINGTESREYAGVNREVQYAGVQMGDSTVSISEKLYWDSAKGVLCEMSMVTSAGGSTMSLSFKLIETNIWEDSSTGSSGQGLWIPAVVIIIVAGVVAGSAFLVWRRRRAPLPEATPAPKIFSYSLCRVGGR
jgi:hypothetical protein